MAEFTKNVPYDSDKYASPMEFLEKVGAFEDPDEPTYHEPYLRPLLAKSRWPDRRPTTATGIITKDGKGIGILYRRPPVVGFKTPSRKLEVLLGRSWRGRRSNEDVTRLTAIANSKGKNRPEATSPTATRSAPGRPTWRSRSTSSSTTTSW